MTFTRGVTLRRIYCFLVGAIMFSANANAQKMQNNTLENKESKATVSINGLTALMDPSDPFQANVVNDRSPVKTKLTFKIGNSNWLDMDYYRQ